MQRTTPILIRDSDYYCQRNYLWLCRDALSELFTRLPKRVSLQISTRPDPEAVDIFLRRPNGCFETVHWGLTEDDTLHSLYLDMENIAGEFVDAGHTHVYITLWER